MSGDQNELRKTMIRVGSTILVGLIFQTGALLWWGGRMSARMDYVEDGLNEISQRLHSLETTP